MVKRELRLLAGLATALSIGVSGVAVGCSLINTDDLTGGLPEGDGGHGEAGNAGCTGNGCVDGGEAGALGPPCPGGDYLGSPTSCGTCGYDCVGGACVGNVCQPVDMAIAGQARAIVVFNTLAIVWSTVTAVEQTETDASCAVVSPSSYGLATSSIASPDGTNSGVFPVFGASLGATYATGLATNTKGIIFQDTAPTLGVNYVETGFTTKKPAGVVDGGAVFGLAEPPSGAEFVFFADTATPGPHEYAATLTDVDSTGALALDPLAPAELHTMYDTAALAVDENWLYYGTADGVFRIKLGATCVHPAPVDAGKHDAGDDDAGLSCEDLFVREPTAQVTALLVDDQYLYVATTDGALTRYNTLDGSDPTMLSTQGPFYGLAQYIDVQTATPTIGADIVAASSAGPILEIAKSGAGSKTLATSTLTPTAVAIDEKTAYWVEDGETDTAHRCAVGNGRLMRVRR